MKIELQWLLEGIWRQYRYKVKKIHLKFQSIARQKNACLKKVKSCIIRTRGAVSFAPAHGTTLHDASYATVYQAVCLVHGNYHQLLFACFPNCFCWKTLVFILLTPKHWCIINRDSCPLFYSLKKLEVKGKSQPLGASRQSIYIILLFSLRYVFIFYCNDACCHVQVNLFD